jgi:hypothetical protein
MASNHLFKQHNNLKGKLRRKCSEWLPLALKHASHLLGNSCKTSAEIEAPAFVISTSAV